MNVYVVDALPTMVSCLKSIFKSLDVYAQRRLWPMTVFDGLEARSIHFTGPYELYCVHS